MLGACLGAAANASMVGCATIWIAVRATRGRLGLGVGRGQGWGTTATLGLGLGLG